MSLLSPLALLFGLTALVPLILHLYQRRRRTVMLFSTNRFFTDSIVRSQRRLRLHRLLLLLLRMAACVLLALALAQPILRIGGLGGSRPGNRDLVIVLDDSLSMQAVDDPRGPRAGRPTNFDKAKKLAIDMLHELSSGDRAAVVTFTGRTLGRETRRGTELSNDPLTVAEAIEKLIPTFAAGDAYSALTRSDKLFSNVEQRTRIVTIITDLQANDWKQTDWPEPQHPVSSVLIRSDRPAENNIVVDQMFLSQPAAVAGQPNLLHVRLVNYRSETTAIQLVLLVDGKVQVRRPIELAGTTRQIEHIPLLLEEPGEHRLVLKVEYEDALTVDNTFYAGVMVIPRLPVLLIDGEAEDQSVKPAVGRQSAAFFIRAALRSVGAESDGIQVNVIKPSDLPSVALDKYRVVLLSNVQDLTVGSLQQLESFVGSGGGLAIFLGYLSDRQFYNHVMGASARPMGGLLPAELRSLVGVERAAQPIHITRAELDHPILQRFKGTLRSALAGVDIHIAHAVTPKDAWVIASMTDNLPLMLERSYGQGKVLLVTTAPDPRWTNLPLRRVFIPLMNRMVSYLAGSGAAELDEQVGREIILHRGGWDYDQPMQIKRPDGESLQASIKVFGAEPVSYLPAEVVDRPGFYRLQPPKDSRPKSSGSTMRKLIAVNTPRRESAPQVMDPQELVKLAGHWQLQIIDLTGQSKESKQTDRAIMASLLTGGRASRGIWDTLLWLVLILLLIEPLIANKKSKVKPAESKQRITRAA